MADAYTVAALSPYPDHPYDLAHLADPAAIAAHPETAADDHVHHQALHHALAAIVKSQPPGSRLVTLELLPPSQQVTPSTTVHVQMLRARWEVPRG